MKTFEDLKVWQKAHNVILEIYKVTKSFPLDEKFGLSSQVRRSSVSIASNIVEGFKRRSKKEFKYFLNIAESSLEETKYHLLLSYDLDYVNKDVFNELKIKLEEIGRMLYGLNRKLNP